MKKTFALIILDGYGTKGDAYGNAVLAAKKPNMDRIFKENPSTELGASGLSVGLPDGQMGNSEVGHLNMGAGRIVYQAFTLITKEIKEGTFFDRPELLDAMNHVKKQGSKLHVYGLFSDGGVHSHNDHLKGLLTMAKKNNLSEVYIHAFTDGRDTDPNSGLGFAKDVEAYAAELGIGKIASVSGRYYAMDRDNRWERIEQAYRALTEGATVYDSAEALFEHSYNEGITDEFIVPACIAGEDGKPLALVEANDAIIFYNFRPDRAREITRAFVDEDFKGFERTKLPVHYVCMTQYDATIEGVSVVYKAEVPKNSLGEYVAVKGLQQLRIAETEKYAHVTFFFGGGREKPYKGEDRILVPSPKVATYDLQPEMSAYGITDRLVEEIHKNKYDLIVCNFANPDMVGHTGVFDATVKAIEAVDECIGKIDEAMKTVGGSYIITADHGNSESMKNPDGSVITAHTTNPVPFVLVGEGDVELREDGKLADVAPTILEALGIEKPAEMTESSLVKK